MKSGSRCLWLTALSILLTLPGLALGGPAPVTPGIDDPIPDAISQGMISVTLETVASNFTAPIWGASAPGDASQLYVAEQTGQIWSINLTTGDVASFLDVSGRLVMLGAFGEFDERGLLGFAFHPGFATNRLVYTYTSEPVDGAADFSTIPDGGAADHQSVIAEWAIMDPAMPPAAPRILIRIDQPQFNHNAGALAFGSDNMLYIAVGDGGGADDADGPLFLGAPIIGHGALGNGQDTTTILGNILRIDPNGNNAPNGQYGVPMDNPFAGGANAATTGGQAGCADGLCDEIYAYGFRNPFRMSVDQADGTIYTGDVGQNDIEEVDIVIAGGNYGWRTKEGRFLFDTNGDEAGFVYRASPGQPLGMIDPIAEYDHDEGISVIGGFVHRGDAASPLFGKYIFGEFSQTFNVTGDGIEIGCDSRLFSLTAPPTDGLAELVQTNQAATPFTEFQVVGADGPAPLSTCILGFAQDAQGEIYLLGNTTGKPFVDPATGAQTGVVLKIVPAPVAP